MNARRPLRPRLAFSLIEVVLALAVASFCLISISALIPTALIAVRNAQAQSAAEVCLEQISASIVGATSTSPGVYQTGGVWSNTLSWSLGGNSNSTSIKAISLGGLPSATDTDQSLTAYVTLTPPRQPSKGTANFGSAYVTIAWPSQATWNSSTFSWKNAQGSISSWIVFLPN